jgi:hypothetical protein
VLDPPCDLAALDLFLGEIDDRLVGAGPLFLARSRTRAARKLALSVKMFRLIPADAVG